MNCNYFPVQYLRQFANRLNVTAAGYMHVAATQYLVFQFGLIY